MSPVPDLPDDPSNAVADDPRAQELGSKLFFDRRLSPGGEVSCSSCHDPEASWADRERVSDPDALFPKNAPSLWNVAFNRWYFWDGRADSAWAQALGPLEDESELGGNRLRVLHRVNDDPELRSSYVAIFGEMPSGLRDPARFPPDARPVPDDLEDPLHTAWASMTEDDRRAANRVFVNVGKSIAAFERQLILRDTRFDRFVVGLDDPSSKGLSEISPAALRGLKTFVGRGQCALCHSGPLLSDGEFHDVGIALGEGMRVDPGRYNGVLKIQRSSFTRSGRYADAETPYAPIDYLEPMTQQMGQFKTPMLRNVAQTAPYMHDGRFETLTEVVRFYSTRKGATPLGHPVNLLQPLDLTEVEIDDLVEFLHSLSAEDVGGVVDPLEGQEPAVTTATANKTEGS